MRSDSGTYQYPPDGREFYAVTEITSGTDSKPWLNAWHGRVAAKCAVANIDRIAGLVAAGRSDEAIALIMDEGERIRAFKADVGVFVHDTLEKLIMYQNAGPDGVYVDFPDLPEHLRGLPYDGDPVEQVADAMIGGFMAFCADWHPEILYSEMTVFNDDLEIAGTLDMIVLIRDADIVQTRKGAMLIPRKGVSVVLLIDAKTGRNLDKTTREQIVGYRRMKWGHIGLGQLIPMPPTHAAAVLHLRQEFKDGYRLELVAGKEDAEAWHRFRQAASIYIGRKGLRNKVGRVARPPRPDGTVPAAYLDDLRDEGYGAAPSTLIKAGLTSVDEVAAFTEADLRQVRGIGKKGDKTIAIIRRMLADEGLWLAGDPAPSPHATEVFAA